MSKTKKKYKSKRKNYKFLKNKKSKKNLNSKKKKKNKVVKVVPITVDSKRKPIGGRIYILYTGGTIGMIHSDNDGLVPIKGNLIKLMKRLNIDVQLNVEYVIESIPHLIDSSNLQTSKWKIILDKLTLNRNNYDSFIILHGTDTLAYTASALSFFLRDWNKSVIITGSQIPLFEFRNDATRNVIDSIIISLLKIPEVMIVFGGTILRGNCATKISSTSFDAFGSPNLGAIGNIGVHINIFKNKLQNKTFGSNIPNINISGDLMNEGKLRAKLETTSWNLNDWKSGIKIETITLLPEKNTPMLKAAIALKPNAIIIRSYGIGNAPMGDDDFVKALKLGVKKNIIIVNTTQCLNGGVNMDYYRTGRYLKELGVIGCQDMTLEAIFTKLYYLFQIIGQDKVHIPIIKELFQIDLAGEITVNQYDINVRNYLINYFNIYQEL